MKSDTRKLRVFLCHALQDKPIVRELYQRLLAESWVDPWLDEKKLITGQNWDIEIEKAVESSDAVIVFLSNHSITKEGYVQKELRRVLDKAEEKPDDVIFIIPLRLEECIPPRRLRPYQYQNYFPVEEQKNEYAKLRSALKARFKQLLTRETEEERKANKEKAKQAARIRAQKTRAKLKEQKLREESERKRAEELARKEAEQAEALAQKKAKEEAEVLAKKIAEEKIRRDAEELVRKAEEALGRKWVKEKKLLDKVEVFSFPDEIIKKRITTQEITGWLLGILILILMVLFTNIISQYTNQSGSWGGIIVFLTWICLGSFLTLIIVVTIASYVSESIGRPDSRKIRYGLPRSKDFIFLATNGILGKLDLVTGEASVLKKGLNKRKGFVLISDNQKIALDNGVVFDIEKQEDGKLKSFKDSYYLWDFNPDKQLFLLNDFRSVIIMDSNTNSIIEELPSRHLLFKTLSISHDGNLVVALCSVKDPKTEKYYPDVQIWRRGQGEFFHTIPSFSDSKVNIKLSPDNKLLAIGGNEKIILYSLITNKVSLEYKIKKKRNSQINSFSFVARNKLLVASLTDEMLIIDIENGSSIYVPLKAENVNSQINIDELFYFAENAELLGLDKQSGKLFKWKF